MAKEIPTTQKDQLAAFFTVLNAPDFAAAVPILENWQASAADYNAVLALFQGVTDHAGLVAAIKELRTNAASAGVLNTIFSQLGVTDQNGAAVKITQLTNDAKAVVDLNSIFAKVGPDVKDVAGAIAAIENLRTGFDAEVLRRIAATGLQMPVPKEKKETGAAGGANIMSRAEFNTLNPRQQTEFSAKGGKLTDE